MGKKYKAIKYQPFGGSGGELLPPNQTMRAGQFIKSPSGRFLLRLKGDGNLVLEDAGVVVWVADHRQKYSSTFRNRSKETLHFVVSNSAFLYDPARERIWSAQSTETLDRSYWTNNYLKVSDTGNILIFDGRNGDIRWAREGYVPGRLPRRPKIYPEIYPPIPGSLIAIPHDFP
ncbi:hypothetical protein [Pseudomonas xanthosomatis]|uniref:hypothetical protein n=1 Tax=Pseudomonas xanthosomatis TaxID=2842356 RepID=UPI0035116CC4